MRDERNVENAPVEKALFAWIHLMDPAQPVRTHYILYVTNGHNLLLSEKSIPAQYRLKGKTLKAYD